MASCGTVTVKPAFSADNVSLTGCNLRNSEVTPQDSIAIEVGVENANDDAAAVTLAINRSGSLVASEELTVGSNMTTTHVFEIDASTLGVGEHSLQSEIVDAARGEQSTGRSRMGRVRNTARGD